MNKLLIDTTDNKKTVVGIDVNGKKKEIVKFSRKNRSQDVLILIDQILKKNDLGLEKLDQIIVNEGPGSFTGIKVGVSIANAIASSLLIPINGNKIGVLVEGKY